MNSTDTGRYSDAILLASDGKRVVALRPSDAHPELLKVYSAPVDEFAFEQATAVVSFDAADDGIVILPGNTEALQILRGLIGSHPFTVATTAPTNVQAILRSHFELQGTSSAWCVVTEDKAVPPYIQRIYDRLGDDGFQIIGSTMTFGPSMAAFRLAVRTFLYHKSLEDTKSLRDSLIRELTGWNLVSQAYVALETFCALFSALGTSKSDPSKFAFEYLRFGRNEADLKGPSVLTVLDAILGKRGGERISDALSIPLSVKDIKSCGLDDCGVPADLLIAAGKHSRNIVLFSFRRLALTLIEGRDPSTGRPIKTIPAKAYGAFRHGFATGFPLHSPRGIIVSDDPSVFASEDDFLAYYNKAHNMAHLMYLGEADPGGDRPIVNIVPPVYTRQLKPFVRIIYLASRLTFEVAKYARSFFGSSNLCFPYLVNSIDVLGEQRRLLLQQRLDELEDF